MTYPTESGPSCAQEDARSHQGKGRLHVYQGLAGLTIELAVQIQSVSMTQAAIQRASAMEVGIGFWRWRWAV